MLNYYPQTSVPLGSFLARQICFLLPVCLMVAFFELAYFPSGEEGGIFLSLSSKPDSLNKIMKICTDYGNPLISGLYLIFFARALHRRDGDGVRLVLAYLIVQLTLTLFAVQFLKRALGRPRPFTLETEWRSFSGDQSYYSLPSGHTAEISVSSGVLAQISNGRPWICMLWGLIPAFMGFTRIYLGMHHPTDVLAGAIVGSISTYAVLRIAVWLRNRAQAGKERSKSGFMRG